MWITSPVASPILIRSPTRNGRRTMIWTQPKKLCRVDRSARPITTEAIPSEAAVVYHSVNSAERPPAP